MRKPTLEVWRTEVEWNIPERIDGRRDIASDKHIHNQRFIHVNRYGAETQPARMLFLEPDQQF